MGSQTSKFSKTVVGNETHNSARNVLEGFAKDIKGKASSDAEKHAYSLKGNLKDAKFYNKLFISLDVKKDVPSNPCYLNYVFHTNVWNDRANDRDPCLLRDKERFSNEGEAECGSDKIRGNENNRNDGTACAPYRRRHMCDYNLEFINEQNVLTTHDLLGNVLVMAKSEGESIVKNHPNRGSSEVCTALARSFADIGDIIRGRDMFLGNNETDKEQKVKLEKNLKNIFKKIYEELTKKNGKKQVLKARYKKDEEDGNYYKLREDWWALNREDVWKALTCSADGSEEYFIQSESNKKLFSNSKCGHDENKVLTNLDYVPQYLRWFEEWAEDFCRKKKDKLNKVKEACRGKTDEKYCSHNGYDCTKTIWKKGVLHWSNECTDCSVKCKLYEIWLHNQREAFDKQKEKYEKEINEKNTSRDSTNNSINNIYYEDFYKKYKEKTYNTVDKFINLLNEGRYCNKKEKIEEEVINFTKADEKGTFSRSQYCQVCPDCGVKRDGTKYTHKLDNDPQCVNKLKYEPPWGVKPTEITVLYSGDEEGDISKKLKDFCNNSTNYKGENNQKWECYYKHEKMNKCKMEQNSKKDKDKPKITQFHNFFEFWVTYLLKDTILWNDKFKTCMNNTNITDCNDGCNKHCVCFDKWVKQKEQEWNKIKELLTKEQNMVQQYYHKINYHFQGYFFHVMNKLNNEEAKWKELTQELKKKMDFSKANTGTNDSQDAIKVLLDHLKDNATICKDNNTNEACPSTVDTTENPCVNNTSGGGKHVNVKQIAQYYKRKAYSEANNRSDGLHKLKGKAHEGIYKCGCRRKDFKDKLCRIMIKHSNRNPGQSQGPCYGKDGGNNGVRMKIGTTWHTGSEVKMSHNDLYLPPRRQHICTSNLEKIDVGRVTKKSNVNASFLVHVLLAAKMDAQKINDLYKSQNGKTRLTEENDKATVCRAIRYSFADIGDIIRGKDMWADEKGMGNLKRHLKTVFDNIGKSLKDKGIKTYDNDPNHIKIREDWWEANRHQVWKAMKCHISNLNVTSYNGKSSSHCGYSDHTPLDDYVPQRLRWMTEWAEWYCKVQKEEYDKLKQDCTGCKAKGSGKECWKTDSECSPCKQACEEYKRKIKPWAEQWKVISNTYKKLYKHARVDIAANGGPKTSTAINDNEDKSVIEFLFELYKENGGEIGNPAVARATVNGISTDDTTPTVYSTAEGYIHQEAHISDCKQQHVFCESGGKDKYTFKEVPQEYEQACNCENNTKPPPSTTPSTPNPCVNGGDKTRVGKITSVKDVAEGMQRDALTKMLERSVKEGDKGKSGNSCLVGNIKEAKFGKAAKSSDLDKGKICDLDEHKHTNVQDNKRGYYYKGPCTGKNQERFKIGTQWSFKDNVKKKTHPDAYMPQRREHMCTSNLENLDLSKEGLSNSSIASNSLLGDVLLAAKYEGLNIMNLYLQNNRKNSLNDENDKATVCRAMKYSFADIGDIIRGKDLWDLPDFKKLEGYLVTIFEKIKDELKSKLNGKYEDNSEGKHLELRKDWWEANRDQVWEAMQCPSTTTKPPVTTNCDTTTVTPLVDYIPQRLRWMTEWAEWYCKMQKEEYEKLVRGCGGCRSKGGKCEKECGQCKEKCKEYEQKIKKWEDQWEKISQKYNDLYQQAKLPENSKPTTSGGSKDENDVVAFLSKLQEKNKGSNTIYSTAAGFIHQEAHINDCQKQTQFCNKNSDGSDKNYAFEPYPYDYKEKCNCKDDTRPQEKKKEDVCDMVKELLENNDGTQEIDHCKPKYYPNKQSYPKWNCDTSKIKSEHSGACMPPRRIKLCVIKLQHLSDETPDGLRKAFIKCAAIETFWLWQKYKKDKNGGDAEEKLNSGIIPEEFKRQMFYTFGDYRDLCLDKNIGKDVRDVESKIKDVFQKMKTTTAEQRETWWKTIENDVWDGMLCALSYNTNEIKFKDEVRAKLMNPKNNNTYPNVKFSEPNGATLPTFAQRPQFLRWMTEWGEEFCKKRKEQLKKLEKDCER
ncbi:hypothetical protein PFMC_01261, partial [Plasmodium falciparum CAMP/Malaysia]